MNADRNRLPSLVGQDVEQPPERISDIEAFNAPRLLRRTICGLVASVLHPFEHRIKVVDLDREVGHGSS